MKDMQVFKVFDDVDTRLFSDCVSIMKERYEDAVNNRLSAESRGELIKNILSTQLRYEGTPFKPKKRNHEGFWTLFEISEMPGDAVTDFAFMPTYFATAILIDSVLKDEKLCRRDSIAESLNLGLEAAARSKFSGHGYEGADFFTEAFSIYHRADVYSFVLNYPSFCPEFTEFWISAVKGLLKYPLEPDDWSVSSELAEKSKLLRCEVLAKHSDFAKKATGLLRKTV